MLYLSLYLGGQPRQGSGGSRGIFNSAWASAEGSRNLGGRRSGRHNDGVDGGSRGMRRRGGGGGGGDNVVVSFRVPENEHLNDRGTFFFYFSSFYLEYLVRKEGGDKLLTVNYFFYIS